MVKYVVIFLFTKDFERVWLMEKQKPKWQKGCLNGIGGKIEAGENPWETAHRELEEEAGIPQGHTILQEAGIMSGTNNDNTPFEVTIFTGATSLELKSQESEQIYSIPIGLLKDKKLIENIPSLIELCLYHQTGSSHFKKFILNY